ncbi:MAG: hypothetical protein AAF281_11560 [Pseudomonadota bacterium]
MAYDDQPGSNAFRYRIVRNLNGQGIGAVSDFFVDVPGLGHSGEGAGAALTDLDDDPRPDLILMAYDAPDGANSFRYVVAQNLDANGSPTQVSALMEVPGVGHLGDGAGLAVGQLDNDSRPDAIFMAYDAPSGANEFRFKVALNLDGRGMADRIGDSIVVPGTGNEGDGAGIALAQLDGDPRPDLILLSYDAPDWANEFRYRVALNLDQTGRPARVAGPFVVPGVGHDGDGAGMAVFQTNAAGNPTFILMAYDALNGRTEFRYRAFEVTASSTPLR